MNTRDLFHKLTDDEREDCHISESELHDRYDEMLDDVYGTVRIAGLEYTTSDCLKTIDPVAYRCGFDDWLDSESDNYIEINGEYYSVPQFEHLAEEK